MSGIEKLAQVCVKHYFALENCSANMDLKLLKSTLVNRKERWKLFQRAITARARVQFMWMLSERDFRGRLLANHKEKKLDLQVSPNSEHV